MNLHIPYVSDRNQYESFIIPVKWEISWYQEESEIVCVCVCGWVHGRCLGLKAKMIKV